MRLLVRDNPRSLALVSSSHSLTFRQVGSKRNGLPLRSGPDRPKVEVRLQPNHEITRERGYRNLINREVFGCLGLINVANQIFVAVITGASTNVARPLPYESVDKIYNVEFMSLSSDEWDYLSMDSYGSPTQFSGEAEDADTPTMVHPCFEFKKLLSNGSFYYSNDFDLTSRLQSRGVDTSKLHGDSPEDQAPINVQHYQEQFMWNSFLMDELIKFRSNLDSVTADLWNRNRFLTTVIRGFAKTVRLGGTRADTISVISKQSWKRAGTRFNARGIDDDGNVANFVETEFIYNNASLHQVFLFTQIRGSVPSFWEQDSTIINPKITITRSREASQPSFDKHFTEVCKKYAVCHIINLLSKTKALEVDISRRYVDLLKHSTHREDLLYTHFDFHAETKPLSGGFAGASKILTSLNDSLERFGWFDFDTDAGEVITRQNGVFRVNCLDCLDRTNLIEQVICQTIVEHILQNLGSMGNPRDRMKTEELITKHNALWADNGDAISQIYTGTNALKSSFSRSGKMNIAGALSDVTKSVSRMYQNTFVDSKKQSTIDTLLGKDGRLSIPVKIFDPMSDYVLEKIKQNEASFVTYSQMTLFTGTFNVNAATPSTSPELLSWLFPAENAEYGCPDIYAIGLQELIELNAGLILAADNSRPGQWARVFQQLINSQNESYSLLRTESITSMCLFFFVKESLIDKVTQVSGSSKKTGMGGMTANKGACAVRFEFGSTSFALVTSHFAAGVGATIERHNDYMSIMLGLTFARNYTIGDHDNVIWFGDLNYRINMPNDQCRFLIESGAFDELQASDQLLTEKDNKGGPFFGFQEERILFHPTYKYDKGTCDYDTSEKQRVPSWTDRVLYRSKNSDWIKSRNYSSIRSITMSDHKPVFSTFACKVKFVDEHKKKELTLEYYNSYKANNGLIRDFDMSEPSQRSTKDSSFMSDTLSELNLLDMEDTPPKLPARSNTITSGLTPRRVPPPPLSRRAVPVSLDTPQPRASESRPNSNVLKPETNGSRPTIAPPTRAESVPPPPPARNNVLANLAFSSMPLTPSNSGPSRSASPAASVTPKSQAPNVLKPLKPSKPTTLSSSKIETIGPAGPSQIEAASELKPAAPKPPPARGGSSLTMSDWKPLVPK